MTDTAMNMRSDESTTEAHSARSHVGTWELQVEHDLFDSVRLASLLFASPSGFISVDGFTPDALRSMAEYLISAAHDMDGLESMSVGDYKQLLAEAHRYLGCYPYEVPDELKQRIELAAGINRFSGLDEPET